ncbi:WAT1-related protein [Acorus calamus]|uniref:WAT1-related protein n=1 Tax=Acorus calamus TaxID=4465 RepID=A0AAV9E199_ACOCL|nr:WAT1-related protein [Acorus calamus]
MIIIQLLYGGSNILSKLALDHGMSYMVFTTYRHALATLILGPLAFALERKCRTSMSWLILMKIFSSALVGVTIQQNLYYAGLNYTSPTVAGSLSNIIPALTFILAVILRMEVVNMRNTRGRAKLLGTAICVAGALIFIFSKGPLLRGFVSRPVIKLHGKGSSSHGGLIHAKGDWIKGSALISASYVASSAWLILQAIVYEVYPAKLSTTALTCFFASIQSSALALIFERKMESWRLGWNIQLVNIIYCGTVLSCLVYYLLTWCVSRKGPVFTAMFYPLSLVVMGTSSTFLFAERLHLGSLIGAFIISGGLYSVLWGKSAEGQAREAIVEECECGRCVNSSSQIEQIHVMTHSDPGAALKAKT